VGGVESFSVQGKSLETRREICSQHEHAKYQQQQEYIPI
jgi:hypothetical protein